MTSKHPISSDLSPDYTPSTYLQASKHPHWRQAMQEEFNALIQTGIWSLVPVNLTQNLVGAKWVFRIKRKPDGTLIGTKLGLLPKASIDNKALIILRHLVQLPSLSLLGFFSLWLLSLIGFSINLMLAMPFCMLSSLFPVKDLGPLHYFLGIEVKRSSSGILLSQTKYILDLLSKAHMESSKPCVTPLSTTKLDHESSLLDKPEEYRSLVSGCSLDRRSTRGFCVYLGDSLISWSAKKQPTVARSSIEAEYRSLANTCS
ncbi:uncharacterized mitochondrial protein AtMg00810-like [Pyrus communis]|uniref:uncharacterized mitochondrial protein AtMg00810-like n=1 Tax=Pyrus communis TaxID=23211 RepID=UPI0035C0A50C